jgi:hypothetical protein
MELSNITLVSICGISDVKNVSNTFRAILYSMRGLKFGDVKFITSYKGEDLTIECDKYGIKHIKIDELDYEGYNRFVVYDLKNYVDTDYVIIIQDDGYIINPHLWNDKFFEYDYIGAPWPMPQDNFSYRDAFNNLVRVGNGGFSFRSKKLLSLPSELNLEWKPFFGFYNEDGFFTCHNRHFFEAEGCKYAPVEVAVHFSFESEIPENKGIIPFGFHGKWSKYKQW